MSQRELKEAFVSNLNGTSLKEVVVGSFLAPLCLISRGLILILYHQGKGTLPLPWIAHLSLDFSTLILPLVLSCTILSDVLPLVIVSLAVVAAGVFIQIYRRRSPPAAVERFRDAIERFLQSHVQCDQVPFVTVFRVLVNVKTAISILAVDFTVFPRRYAKTETYGTGIMDFGVGAYVLANALVCPEARRKEVCRSSKFAHVIKQLLSVWPLVILGVVRLVSVKMTGYHEHVSEYGVHWNFFFTLAIVRVVASVLLALFPLSWSGLVALLIGGFYQIILETSGLKSFIVHNGDRTTFLQANKEGICSVVGYIAIYMAGVQIGLHMMRPRTQVREWFRLIGHLLLGSCVLYVMLYLCQTFVEPVSRRMANAPFCLWTIAQSLFFLSCLATADMALVFLKSASSCCLVSSSWNPHKKDISSTEDKIKTMDGLCLIQAVNRNQLLFFLLANLMTGLTNMLVDTFSSSDSFAVCVLLSYMFMNCFVIFILHLCKVTVKFW